MEQGDQVEELPEEVLLIWATVRYESSSQAVHLLLDTTNHNKVLCRVPYHQGMKLWEVENSTPEGIRPWKSILGRYVKVEDAQEAAYEYYQSETARA